MNEAFWRMLDDLVKEHEIVIDRPKGSRHPRYPQIVYRLDYGYLKGTSSMDGGGIDLSTSDAQTITGSWKRANAVYKTGKPYKTIWHRSCSSLL